MNDSATSSDRPLALTPVQVDCPACRQPSEYSALNPYRPFCSKLCRMTDLGRWAQEDFRLEVRPTAEDLD